jgi:hypothetical protein
MPVKATTGNVNDDRGQKQDGDDYPQYVCPTCLHCGTQLRVVSHC